MSQEIEVLILVASRLDAQQIPYMITGSVAMNFYAKPRMTRDIDLVIEISDMHAAGLVRLFGREFYVEPELILQATRNEGMFNLIHTEYVIKVDCVIKKHTPYRKLEFERRRQIQVHHTPIWIVSPEDLILSKLIWAKDSGSEKQLTDVKNILEAQAVDTQYLKKQAKELGIVELYETLINE